MNIEEKQKRIEKLVKLAVLAVTGFFVAPFIFIAIKGLIGLFLAGVVAVAAVNLAPWVGFKFANWRLRAIKAEAAARPIETLQNIQAEKEAAIKAYAASILKFKAEVIGFAGKLVEFKKRFPDEAKKFDDQYSAMQSLLELRQKKYGEARDALDRFGLEIEKARAVWEMTQAATVMTEAGGESGEVFMRKIKEQTAIDSVQNSLNSAIAGLDMAMIEEGGRVKQIENVEGA